MIRFDDVSLQYDGANRPVLDHVDLDTTGVEALRSLARSIAWRDA